jgi:hypothetical protein
MLRYGAEVLSLARGSGFAVELGHLMGADGRILRGPAMTIISPDHVQDHYSVSRTFPGGFVKPDHNFVAIGLLALLGLALSAAAICSGAAADIGDFGAFLG